MPQPRRHLLDGMVYVLLGEALFFPTGLITVAFLTRRLGPEGYGLVTLAMAPVVWIEWGIASLFSRATVKLAGDAGAWRPLGTAIVRLHLLAGCGAALLLLLLAGPLAALLGEPVLAQYVRLFSLDIPLISLIYAHRSLLVGIGGFRQRALAAAARWTARLLLIVLLVQLGLSVTGAILGSIGASLVELAVVRFFIHPPLLGRAPAGVGELWTYATPLFLSAVSLRLFDRLDLFMLKALGAATGQAGIYGAAQNLSFAPRVFALSLSSLLLATLSRMLRSGDERPAAELGRDAERFAVMLLPIAGIAAGSAPELVGLVLGPGYALAAPLLAVLVFGAVASVGISISTAILTAAERPGWTLRLSWPLLPLAAAGHLLAIPRFGPMGAASVTTACAALGALVGMLAVHRSWSIFPPFATVARSLLLTACAYGVSVLWPAPGVWVLLKLSVLGAAAAAGFLLLGELKLGEISLAWWTLLRRVVPEQDPAGPE